MKKKKESLAARFAWMAVIAALLLVGGATTYQKVSDSRGPNYEEAQRATVLIQTTNGQGSGVIVKRETPEGGERLFIWTASHVIDKQPEVTVKRVLRYEGHKAGEIVFRARVLADFPEKDVALLWLNAPPSEWGSAEFETGIPLKPGEEVFHVGNFYGIDFDGSVSSGVISQVGIRPSNPSWPWALLDQTTTAMVPGSSGGPVFHSRNGRVVGLVVGGPTRGLDSVGGFVPVRVIEATARKAELSWAVRGRECPADETIFKLANVYFAEQAAASTNTVARVK